MKINEVTGSEAKAKYEAFIAAIDNSIAGRNDNNQTLADRVAGSAEQNASDTPHATVVEYWDIALETARFMFDDWRNNYPELRI